VTTFLPATAEVATKDLLAAKLAGVDVKSMSGSDFDEDGQLVFRPPCSRTRYVGSMYESLHDNSAVTYNCDHIIEVWCCASNLRSREDQREDTKALAGKILEQLAGARLALADGSKSEPVRIVDVKTLETDLRGTIVVVSVAVPGIAQFDGVNA
jgi:hypothetical protein